MNITTEDLVKLVGGCVAAGGGFAIIRPFADRVFTRWLDRADREQAAREKKEHALEQISVHQERATGVMERFADNFEHFGQRLERVEQILAQVAVHNGLTITAIVVPPAPALVDPRASLSGAYPAQPPASTPNPQK